MADTARSSLWDVTRDGQSFVIRNLAPPPGTLELVVNWFDELKRLVDVPR